MPIGIIITVTNYLVQLEIPSSQYPVGRLSPAQTVVTSANSKGIAITIAVFDIGMVNSCKAAGYYHRSQFQFHCLLL